MAIDKSTATHMAKLSRLNFSQQELQKFIGEFEVMLQHIEKVQRVDTEGIEPTISTAQLTNVFRTDEVQPSMDNEQLVNCAHSKHDGAYLVPRVVE